MQVIDLFDHIIMNEKVDTKGLCRYELTRTKESDFSIYGDPNFRVKPMKIFEDHQLTFASTKAILKGCMVGDNEEKVQLSVHKIDDKLNVSFYFCVDSDSSLKIMYGKQVKNEMNLRGTDFIHTNVFSDTYELSETGLLLLIHPNYMLPITLKDVSDVSGNYILCNFKEFSLK